MIDESCKYGNLFIFLEKHFYHIKNQLFKSHHSGEYQISMKGTYAYIIYKPQAEK